MIDQSRQDNLEHGRGKGLEGKTALFGTSPERIAPPSALSKKARMNRNKTRKKIVDWGSKTSNK